MLAQIGQTPCRWCQRRWVEARRISTPRGKPTAISLVGGRSVGCGPLYSVGAFARFTVCSKRGRYPWRGSHQNRITRSVPSISTCELGASARFFFLAKSSYLSVGVSMALVRDALSMPISKELAVPAEAAPDDPLPLDGTSSSVIGAAPASDAFPLEMEAA